LIIDVHPGAPPTHDLPAAAAGEFDLDHSPVETMLTVIAAIVAIAFASFLTLLMAMG